MSTEKKYEVYAKKALEMESAHGWRLIDTIESIALAYAQAVRFSGRFLSDAVRAWPAGSKAGDLWRNAEAAANGLRDALSWAMSAYYCVLSDLNDLQSRYNSLEKRYIETLASVDQRVEDARDSGYADGYDEGTQSGYEEGYTTGKDEGFSEGHSDGYDEGVSEGRDEGFEAGREAAIEEMEAEEKAAFERGVTEGSAMSSATLSLARTLAYEEGVIVGRGEMATQMKLNAETIAAVKMALEGVDLYDLRHNFEGTCIKCALANVQAALKHHDTESR